MTLESAFPWISTASALAAAFAGPGSRAGRALRATALAALGLYAYFRWITPTSVPVALACQALGQALLPMDETRWRRVVVAVPAIGWLVFANLYRMTGDGAGVFVGDAVKAALLAAVAIGFGYAVWRTRRGEPRPPAGLVLEASGVLLMVVASLTLAWDFWPVMAGALGVLAGFLIVLYADRGDGFAARPVLRRAAWPLAFLGQAAMAYAFLR